METLLNSTLVHLVLLFIGWFIFDRLLIKLRKAYMVRYQIKIKQQFYKLNKYQQQKFLKQHPSLFNNDYNK